MYVRVIVLASRLNAVSSESTASSDRTKFLERQRFVTSREQHYSHLIIVGCNSADCLCGTLPLSRPSVDKTSYTSVI